VVSRTFTRFVFAAALVFAIAGAIVAWANADALTALDVQALVPSESPALLGPINELGRKGWQCRPERAAASKRATHADLPSDTQP
jgi:hypothetical protein